MPTALGGQGPALLAVAYVEALIGVALVSLRAYSASHTSGKLRWDFVWVVVAVVFGIVGLIAGHIAIDHGLANHSASLSFTQVFDALYWIWICIFIGLPAVTFAKFSIIALLLQVQSKQARWRAAFLWTLGGLMLGTALVQIVLIIVGCQPVEKLWKPYMAGTCDLQPTAIKFSYFQGAVSALSDFLLALWPISIVWNLQTSRRVKIGFCLLMAVGVLPSIASIVRTVMLPRIPVSTDITYTFGTFMFWATTEMWAVVILGSVPPLRPLFLRIFYGVRHAHTSRSTERGTSHRGDYAMQSTTTHTEIQKARPVSTTVLVADDDCSEEHVLAHDYHSINAIIVRREFAVEEVKDDGA